MRLSCRSLEESVGKPLYLIFRYVLGYFLKKPGLSCLLPKGEPCGSNSALSATGLIPESEFLASFCLMLCFV